MKSIKWLIGVFAYSLIGLFIVFLINVIIDPLWFFPRDSHFITFQEFINERQQKTNLLAKTHQQYEAVLIGSSKVACLDNTICDHIKAFNYGCGGADIKELGGFLTNFITLTEKENPIVYIGFEFSWANANYQPPIRNIDKCLENNRSFLYFLTSYISMDALYHSINNLRCSLYQPENRVYYNQNYKRLVTTNSLKEQKFRMMVQDGLLRHACLSEFEYDPNFKKILIDLKKRFPKCQFVAYTSPISNESLTLIEELNITDEYIHWLKDIVDVFGSAIHFMRDNEIAHHPFEYFYDAFHLQSEKTNIIIDALKTPIDNGSTPYVILKNDSFEDLSLFKQSNMITRISHKISDENGQDVSLNLSRAARKHCLKDKARAVMGKDDGTYCSDSPKGYEKCGTTRTTNDI